MERLERATTYGVFSVLNYLAWTNYMCFPLRVPKFLNYVCRQWYTLRIKQSVRACVWIFLCTYQLLHLWGYVVAHISAASSSSCPHCVYVLHKDTHFSQYWIHLMVLSIDFHFPHFQGKMQHNFHVFIHSMRPLSHLQESLLMHWGWVVKAMDCSGTWAICICGISVCASVTQWASMIVCWENMREPYVPLLWLRFIFVSSCTLAHWAAESLCGICRKL